MHENRLRLYDERSDSVGKSRKYADVVREDFLKT